MMSNNSQSVFLLGKGGDSLSFGRYTDLIAACSGGGEFLSFERGGDSLSCYGGDAQPLHSMLPLIVYKPQAVNAIAPFVRACGERNIPITVRCGGTGLAGSAVPSKEGVVLLTGHLKQIHRYDRKKGTVSLEPGVTLRNLNRFVEADGWHFPLSFALDGVAGIAGCLSSNTRGYHQQQDSLYDAFKSVTIVDGRGETRQVSSSWVCGAEGLYGVIIEMEIALAQCPERVRYFSYEGPWCDVLEKLPALRSIASLRALVWVKGKFYFKLEGEKWRVPAAVFSLIKCFPAIKEESLSTEEACRRFISSRRYAAGVGGVFSFNQLPEASSWAARWAKEIGFGCLQMSDLLGGSLHLILESEKDDHLSFSRKMQEFFTGWADYVDRARGLLSGAHGIGKLLPPYMPPFWSEESQRLWRLLKEKWDPLNLFGRGRYFPTEGKSLEKVRGEQ